MGLTRMSKLLAQAREQGIGCGSFSVYSMEAMIGTLKAAEEQRTPVIIQLAEARFGVAPFELVGPMMLGAAKNADVEVAVHLDHGNSVEVIEKALQMGFTSVMYDGSSKSFDENVKNTKKVRELAKFYGADVEAELGVMGVGEDGKNGGQMQCTVPEDAKRFVELTGVDALAVAIGNQHGNYLSDPCLRFDILREIHRLIPDQPLVLHGGSGISDEDFQECIRNGIAKINIATATLNSMTERAGIYFQETLTPNYYGLSQRLIDGAFEAVKHHIKVFNMEK